MADCRKKAVYRILGRLGFLSDLATEPNQVVTWFSLGHKVKIRELAKFDCSGMCSSLDLCLKMDSS